MVGVLGTSSARSRNIIRMALVSAGATLILAAWLLAAVPRAAAQPPPANARTILVVSSVPSTGQTFEQFSTLDAALEAAGSAKDPLILVDPGEYTLRGPVTAALEIRARTLGTGTLSPLDWADCLGTLSPSPPPAVVIRSTGTDPAIRVSLTNPEARVTLAGVGLKSGSQMPAAVVDKGELLVREGLLAGRFIVKGSSARASLASLRVGPGSIGTPFPLAGDLSGGVGAYGLSFTATDRDLALIAVTDGASFRARDIQIADHAGLGICVDGAAATLCGGSIHDINPVSSQGYGRGANVLRGGTLTLHGVHIHDVYEAGVAATGAGTQVLADRGTRINKVGLSSMAQLGVGILGQSGAAVGVEDARLVSCEGPGLYLSKGATGTVARTDFSQNKGAGIVVYGATLTLSQSTVELTTPSASQGMGLGMYIDGRVLGVSSATISGCTVKDNRVAGVWVEGAGGSVSVSGTTLARQAVETVGTLEIQGNGIFARDVCSGLVLTGNRYTGNAGAHVFLSGSNATLSGSSYVTNGVLDFTQQRCTEACVTSLTEADLAVDGLSSTTHVISLCPRYNSVTLSPGFSFGLVLPTIHE